MDARYVLTPKTRMHQGDILFNEIDYFPMYIVDDYQRRVGLAHSSLKKIQEKQPYLKVVVNDMLDRIEFMRHCLKEISEGRNPARNINYAQKAGKYFGVMNEIDLIKEHAPKSYSVFSAMERFYVYMSNTCKTIASDSTYDKFEYGFLPDSQKIEDLIKRFEREQFEKIPFAQLILHLLHLNMQTFKVLREICLDNTLSQNLKDWPKAQINISEGGARFNMHKRFNMGMPVSLFVNIGEDTLKFDARIVSIDPSNKEGFENVAVNFEFPDSVSQEKLRSGIQSLEIKNAMRICADARN